MANGDRDYLESSRQSEIAANSQQDPPPSASLPSHSDLPCPTEPMSVSDAVRFSSMMKGVIMLRSDVESLKKEVSFLNRNCQSQLSTALDTCHVKVYFPTLTSPVHNPAEVSGLLGCPVLLVTPISAKSK